MQQKARATTARAKGYPNGRHRLITVMAAATPPGKQFYKAVTSGPPLKRHASLVESHKAVAVTHIERQTVGDP